MKKWTKSNIEVKFDPNTNKFSINQKKEKVHIVSTYLPMDQYTAFSELCATLKTTRAEMIRFMVDALLNSCGSWSNKK